MTITDQRQAKTRPTRTHRCVLCEEPIAGATGGTTELRSCPTCGHRYVAPILSDADRRRRLEERDAQRSDAARQLAELRRVLVDRRDGLIRFHQDIASLRTPCRIVDASATMGGFLWAAKSNGFQIRGLERSPRLRQLASQHHEIVLEDGSLLEDSLPASSADILVLSRDLDESEQPRALLAAARRVLAANGHLVLESTDAEALPGEDEEDEYALIARPHRFTGAEIVRLLGETGFNLIDLYSPSENALVAIGAPA